MRRLAVLAVAGGALVVAVLPGAASSPFEAELQSAADRLISTSDIPAVITLVATNAMDAYLDELLCR